MKTDDGASALPSARIYACVGRGLAEDAGARGHQQRQNRLSLPIPPVSRCELYSVPHQAGEQAEVHSGTKLRLHRERDICRRVGAGWLPRAVHVQRWGGLPPLT